MNAAAYMLPPDPVLPARARARIPAEFVSGNPESMWLVVDACLNQLGINRDDEQYAVKVDNLGPGDFADGMLSLTVWRP